MWLAWRRWMTKACRPCNGVSLAVHAGEILGLAGVSGNGQTELAQVLEGTRPATAGPRAGARPRHHRAGPRAIMAAGVGRIPEDRHESVVAEMTVAQNMALEHLDEFVRRGMLDKKRIRQHADTLIQAYQIKAKPGDRIRTLSGGNMQKVILARVLERNPAVIVVAQPTRGLDVGATEYVRQKLLEQRQTRAPPSCSSPKIWTRSWSCPTASPSSTRAEIMGILPAAARRRRTPGRC